MERELSYNAKVHNIMKMLRPTSALARQRSPTTSSRAKHRIHWCRCRQYHPVFEKVAHTVSVTFTQDPFVSTSFLQISEKLDHSNAVSIDMCPLLSTAALDAISQGTQCNFLISNNHSNVCLVVLGYPLEDLGADFVTSNLQVVYAICMTILASNIFIFVSVEISQQPCPRARFWPMQLSLCSHCGLYARPSTFRRRHSNSSAPINALRIGKGGAPFGRRWR